MKTVGQRTEVMMMQVGEARQISIGNTSVIGTVKNIGVFRKGKERELLVTYEIPGYGETQPFLCAGGPEPVYGADPRSRIARSGMPGDYMTKCGDDFDWTLYGEDMEMQRKTVNAFVQRFSEFERSGRGLYIFSKARGSGKTYLACIVANEVVKRKPYSVKFITTADLVELVKSRNDDDKLVLDGLYQCRILILDDIGAQDGGQAWINEAIFRLIDYRYRERRPVIFTSNYSTDNLPGDERIADRIDAMSVPVKMPEKKIRRQQAIRDTSEFLKNVLGPQGFPVR